MGNAPVDSPTPRRTYGQGKFGLNQLLKIKEEPGGGGTHLQS